MLCRVRVQHTHRELYSQFQDGCMHAEFYVIIQELLNRLKAVHLAQNIVSTLFCASYAYFPHPYHQHCFSHQPLSSAILWLVPHTVLQRAVWALYFRRKLWLCFHGVQCRVIFPHILRAMPIYPEVCMCKDFTYVVDI